MKTDLGLAKKNLFYYLKMAIPIMCRVFQITSQNLDYVKEACNDLNTFSVWMSKLDK